VQLGEQQLMQPLPHARLPRVHPDSGTDAASSAATARSAATAPPAPPTASPSSTPPRTLTTGVRGFRCRAAGPY
jgi:hypothetical protein